jgi:hypothetical protein
VKDEGPITMFRQRIAGGRGATAGRDRQVRAGVMHRAWAPTAY